MISRSVPGREEGGENASEMNRNRISKIHEEEMLGEQGELGGIVRLQRTCGSVCLGVVSGHSLVGYGAASMMWRAY